MYNNSYAWCLRCNVFSAWFLDIRIYHLVCGNFKPCALLSSRNSTMSKVILRWSGFQNHYKLMECS